MAPNPEEDESAAILMPPPGVHIRLDWMRLVGPEAAFSKLLGILTRVFGDPTSESVGARWFRGGVNWHPGVTLSHGHSSQIIQLDVRGERLTILGTDAALVLMEEVYRLNAFWATRLDAAMDFVDQGIDLHRNATESCRRGELCRIRRYADDSEYTRANVPTRLLLKLGKRESAVCGRIYDKGLETGTAPCGVWERLEIEFKEDRAQTLAMRLVENQAQWPAVLQEAILGSVDFRVVNGRPELDRRPRAVWWAKIVAEKEACPVGPAPSTSDFESWWEWGRGSFVKRFLQFAQMLRLRPEELFCALIDGVQPADTESPAVIDLRTTLAAGKLPTALGNHSAS